MKRIVNILLLVLFVMIPSGMVLSQGPIPIRPPVLIDLDVYNGVYRGVQSQIYCEPNTGNLVASWYRYYSGDPDPRRITAATSTDGGASWTIHEEINTGVGGAMNARYPSVAAISTTPLIAYSDRNPPGANQNSRPVVAVDDLGWGGDSFNNLIVDNSGSADTVLYGRYLSVAVAPDNEDFWAVGTYHSSVAAPGEALYYYYTADGGATWNGPFIPASAVLADSSADNYVDDLSSSGLGVGIGANDEVMISGLAQWENNDDLWRIVYSISTDMGATWSPVSLIPGTEDLDFSNGDFYRQFTSPLQDAVGNWHIFAIGVDTTEDDGTFPQLYRGWDFRYDGSTWLVNKFVYPELLENGIVAWGDYPADVETYPMNEPALGLDSVLYYAYSDVVDTAGSGGDENLFNYNIMVMASQDNGTTWDGPVSVLDQWNGRSPNGMARYATDKIHIAYRRHYLDATPDEFWYLGVPVDIIQSVLWGTCPYIGDLNDDCVVSVLDVILTIQLVLNGDYDDRVDMNLDGEINIFDVILLINMILGRELAKTDEPAEMALSWREMETETALDVSIKGVVSGIQLRLPINSDDERAVQLGSKFSDMEMSMKVIDGEATILIYSLSGKGLTGDGNLLSFRDSGIPQGVEVIAADQRGDNVSVKVVDSRGLPREFALHQSFPNPFNAMTEIRYELPEATKVILLVYNLQGQEVARLVDDKQKAGRHTVRWDAAQLASGVYLYRITAGDYVQTRKMMLLK